LRRDARRRARSINFSRSRFPSGDAKTAAASVFTSRGAGSRRSPASVRAKVTLPAHSFSGVSTTIGIGRALLVTGVPRVGLRHERPQPVVLFGGRRPRRHFRGRPTNQHARPVIALEVEPPGGRQVGAAEGADHDEDAAVPEVRERGRPRPARPPPGRRQEQHRHPGHAAEGVAAAGAVDAFVGRDMARIRKRRSRSRVSVISAT